MASAPAAILSRSIQHLLRRHAATTSALSIVSSKSVIGRINPTEEDPISATGVTNLRFSGDMALFGRFDWPAITASQEVNLLAKKSDDEDFSDEDSDEFDDGDFDSDDFDEDEDVSDSFDGEDDDESENKTVRQAKLKE